MAKDQDGNNKAARIGAFNQNAADLKISELTGQMLQAFYRREFDTVETLSQKGARFTPEMLTIAVHYHDPHLAQKCIDGGVIPNEDLIIHAVKSSSPALVKTLIEKAPVTETVRAEVKQHGTNAVREIFGMPPVTKLPVHEMHDRL